MARRLGVDLEESLLATEDVDRIVNLILDAVQNYERELDEKRLLSWHTDLFPKGMSRGRRITSGAWRPIGSPPMQIVSGYIGKENVHFEAPPPEKLEYEMNNFFEWLNGSRRIAPILKAGIAAFWFVTIHPFEDGNGRISRAITEMLLARADKSSARYYCMSAQIFAERSEYYLQLERQQRNGLNITPWLKWFVRCLNRSLDHAEVRLQNILRNAQYWQKAEKLGLNLRQKKTLFRMLGESWTGFINTSKYSRMCKCSDDTSQRDIRDLIEKGVFEQNSKGGSKTSYRIRELKL